MLCTNKAVSKSFFGTSRGGEHFIVVEPDADLDLPGQVEDLERRYAVACRSLGLAPGSAVFRRVFLSDAMNQAKLVRKSALAADEDGSPVALSLIQQPPLSQAKLALLAYHIDEPGGLEKKWLTPRHVLVGRGALAHLWTTGLCGGADDALIPVAHQTRDVFDRLIAAVAGLGGTLRDNCVRTWIYVKDVDVFYNDMVASRRALFNEQDLTAATHFIASTGIEGACAHRYDIVAMDAYSILGLAPAQISYLNDFEHLCPTQDYNVTFERGTRIAYADRAHLMISGTASIDGAGRVVHPGDVLRQLDRALENVAALLRAGDAGLNALMHVIVYLRDPADYWRVRTALAERLPDVPAVFVQGRVCRPDWLVEIEGIAIAGQAAPALPAF
jgi:enamine deaminase RidA (YjgF/YER057c/UK114 family)